MSCLQLVFPLDDGEQLAVDLIDRVAKAVKPLGPLSSTFHPGKQPG
ncbi:MAG: hypothetical protein WBG92_04810 [Thiohalocapsa sp.]